jgi:hypothetical protein
MVDMTQQTAETGAAVIVGKVGNAAQLVGGSTALYFGFTPSEWQVIGIIGGLGIALVGMLVNVGVNFYFQHKNYKLAVKRIEHEFGDE